MTAPCAKDALFCFATRGFIFATRKTNLNTPKLKMCELKLFEKYFLLPILTGIRFKVGMP